MVVATVSSKEASVAWTIQGSGARHAPQVGFPVAAEGTRFCCRHDGQAVVLVIVRSEGRRGRPGCAGRPRWRWG